MNLSSPFHFLPLPCLGLALAFLSFAAYPGQAAIPLVISEFMAENDSFLRDDDLEYSDWIEIHNYSDQPVPLEGLYLTDNPKNLTTWRFPKVTLPPSGYLLVYASGNDRTDPAFPLHTNFKLSNKGEYLALVDAGGRTPIHEYTPKYPNQKSDLSYGLLPPYSDPTKNQSIERFLEFPTPGESNSNILLGNVKNLRWSHHRGLHQAPFDLVLSTATPDASIFYTTNGSVPSEQTGIRFTQPIPITQTTILRAIAIKPGFRPTPVETQSFLFPKDIIHQSPDGLPPESFPYEWGENKVDYGMDPTIVKDPRYSEEILQGFSSLPSLSLVCEMKDFFGKEKGIYANPGEQGIEWERPCSLELLNPKHGDGFQVDCGMRIRGGYSRQLTNPKHALRLFFRDTYGPSKLRYPLFGDQGAKEFDNVDLRTFQNYSWSLEGDARGIFLRDQFNRDLQLAMNQPASRGEFYHLFINGHYWGLYNTCERVEASYGATYFGGKKSDYDVIKVDSGFTTRQSTYTLMPTDGDMKAWTELYHLASNDLSPNEAYFRLQGKTPGGANDPTLPVYLDVNNLIDYMLIIFWGGNLDAPISAFGGNRNPNNFHAIRNRNARQGFQFFIWDAEHTLLDVDVDRTGPFQTGDRLELSSPQWLWQQCLANAEFRMAAADRIHRHFSEQGVLSPQSLKTRFLQRSRELESAVICESARWGDAKWAPSPYDTLTKASEQSPLNRDEHWKVEIERIANSYLPYRSEVVLSQLYTHGLIPDVPAPKAHLNATQTTLELKASEEFGKAEIYYTTNGKDPRLVGGHLAPEAKKYSNPIPLGKAASRILARSRIKGDWSALEVYPR